ncbi:MAG: hypothetical protein L0287_16245, partial [Anaerolineae bacterium]|nr:hypothetical protein [Anaerolineae bacterium]
RTEAIMQITSTVSQLDDDRVQVLAEIAQSLTHPTVFSTFTANEWDEINAALDEVDRGEAMSGERVFAELHQSIATARDRA